MTNIYTSIGITCIIISTIIFIVYYNSSVEDENNNEVRDEKYLTIAIGFVAIGVSLLMVGCNESPVERKRLTPISGDVGDPYDSIFNSYDP